MKWLLIVRYRDGSRHREMHESQIGVLLALHERMQDHKLHGNVKHWKVIPS